MPDVRIRPEAVCSCVKVMGAIQSSGCWTLPNICLVPFTENVLLMTVDGASSSWRLIVIANFVAKCFAD